MRAIVSRALLCVLLSASVFVVLATSAVAHPLGNFTVNHYSRVEVHPDKVRVRYVLDLAEIPSIQETRLADTAGKGAVSQAEWDVYKQRKLDDIGRQIELTVDGRRLELQPTEVTVSQPLGQGDIPLVRLEAWFQAATAGLGADVPHQATFRDRGDPARVGWREIVVQAASGVALTDASAPAQDTSDELRNYPDNLLQNPPDRRDAHWSFTLGTSDATRPLPPSAGPLAWLLPGRRMHSPRSPPLPSSIYPWCSCRCSAQRCWAGYTRPRQATARPSWPPTSSAPRAASAMRWRWPSV
jgi:hypothetical protein